MTDHWQVIEGCIEGEIASLEKESTWWEDGSPMQKRILADLKEHEDALAFVREMRQGQWMRIIDTGVGKSVMTFDIDEDSPQPKEGSNA